MVPPLRQLTVLLGKAVYCRDLLINSNGRHMSDEMQGVPQRAEGPPWIRPEIQSRIKWRNGDIVISVPPKSGTTWTMNIVYQLLTGGASDFQDIYAEVPWIELLRYPRQPVQEVLDCLEAMPTDRRRAFKTHSAPPVVPFIDREGDRNVKYIVVFRNPEEALVSFRPFLEQLTDAWLEIWQIPKHALCRADFPSFYAEIIDPRGFHRRLFEFLAAWWPLRQESNVLFLHYSDMKRDHEAAIKKIACFLDIEPAASQWEAIFEHTSFEWMKWHQDRFEVRTVCTVPVLNTGAMVRQGQVGKAKCDGMTDDISRHVRQIANEICSDPDVIDWYYEGGSQPA